MSFRVDATIGIHAGRHFITMSVSSNSQSSDSTNARDRLKDPTEMLENFFGKENFSLPTDPNFLGPCYWKRNMFSSRPQRE